MVTLALSVAPAILMAVLYFGVLLGRAAVPCPGALLLLPAREPASALLLYLTNAIAQVTFATLIIAGVLDDRVSSVRTTRRSCSRSAMR